MAVTLRHKRSDISGSLPSTNDVELGELTVNTFDGRIHFKKNDGNGESIVTLQPVSEYNLAINNTPLSNSSSNNLSGVLRDLDSAINNSSSSFQLGADDSTVRTVSSGESVIFQGGNNIATTSDVEGNITIALNTTFTLPTTDGDNGQVLVTDGNGTVTWATLSGSGAALTTINSIPDVDTNGANIGDVLVYNGTKWVAQEADADSHIIYSLIMG